MVLQMMMWAQAWVIHTPIREVVSGSGRSAQKKGKIATFDPKKRVEFDEILGFL